jgi:hypothetical protein
VLAVCAHDRALDAPLDPLQRIAAFTSGRVRRRLAAR